MKIPIKSRHQGVSEKATRLTVPFQYLTLTVSVLFILFLLAGCATMPSGVKLPPVAETSATEFQEGRFIWIDLMTEDVVSAASFYSRLFGWRAAQSKENAEYYLFTLDGKPVAGMTAMESKDATASESLWLATMSVSDVDQSVTAVKTHGGQVLEGPLDTAGRGRMVLVSDKAGAPFILLAAGGNGPAGRKAKVGQWHWIDLVTRDANRARNFYTSLFGYQVMPVEAGEDHRYDIFKRKGRVVAGLVELQWDGLEDNWLPYFKVTDVDNAIEIARNMGGKLILKSGNVAVLTDPTGAAFGIQMH